MSPIELSWTAKNNITTKNDINTNYDSNNFSDHIIYSLQFCFMRCDPQSSGDQ